MRGATQMTAEELEKKAEEMACFLAKCGGCGYVEYEESGFTEEFPDLIRELIVRYRTARIMVNNYKKALEALEHAGK